MALSNRNVMSIYMILLCIIVNIYVSNGTQSCHAMIMEDSFFSSCKDMRCVVNKVITNENENNTILSLNGVSQRYFIYVLKRRDYDDVMFYTEWCSVVENLCMESLRKIGFIHRKYVDSTLRKHFEVKYKTQKNEITGGFLYWFITFFIRPTEEQRATEEFNDGLNFEIYISKMVINENLKLAKSLGNFSTAAERRHGIGYRDIIVGVQEYQNITDPEDYCIADCYNSLREARYSDNSLEVTKTFFINKSKNLDGCVAIFTNEKKRKGKKIGFASSTLREWCEFNCI